MNDMKDSGRKDDPAVPVVSRLLSDFDSARIRYCHWKSNEHAIAAVGALTDLDILFDEAQQHEVDELLAKNGFRLFASAWFVRYPHVFDYLAIDASTGRVVHVHAHFRLVLGEAMVKSYRLPWEEGILLRRIWLPEAEMHASSHEDEFLLLVARLALKRTFGPKALSPDGDAAREFGWLKQRLDVEKLSELAEALLGSGGGKAIRSIHSAPLTPESVRAFAEAMAPCLAGFRRIGWLRAWASGKLRRVFYGFSRINKRIGLLPMRNHRAMVGGGIVVALLGSDGSGKSTQVRRIVHALRKKMDVVGVYMGSGHGHARIYRRPFNFLLAAGKPRTVAALNPSAVAKRKPAWRRAAKVAFSLVLALERRGKLKQVEKARARGAIVVCDRYPQACIRGYNDGPLLDQAEPFAGIEARQYQRASRIRPDLVLKLLGDPAVLHARRAAEMALEQIVKKQAGISELCFDDSVRVVVVDAALPEDQVFCAAMEAIAALLSAGALVGRE